MIVSNSQQSEIAHESGGQLKGVAIAIVTQNKDDERQCRVKVRFPWHDKPTQSYWARLAMPMAGKDRGWVLIPEVGDEVVVAFERQDMRFPYVLGALWNGAARPPSSNDDGKNDKRVFVSRKKHKLLFDDGAQGVVELKHEKGRRIIFHDDGFAVEDEKGNTVKVNSTTNAMTIEARGPLIIKAASITLDATGSLTVKSSGTLSLSGSLVNIN